MFVFACNGCGARVTTPLSRTPLPAHAHQIYGNGIQLPVLMDPGTHAVDRDPWGPPWRTWEQVDPAEAAARGIHAPIPVLSDGPPDAVVVAPGDTRGTVLIPEKCGGSCCGLDGADGPNLACENCALPVGTRVDDCSLWQAVRLSSGAVRGIPADDGVTAPLSWAELCDAPRNMPPFEPMATWGGRLGTSHLWSWSPRWEAAAGRALAHLLAASQGAPVAVPDGPAGSVFQHSLDALLPKGRPARQAVLAGPGLDFPGRDADILLVPLHPQTGEAWQLPLSLDHPRSPSTVPLPLGMWREMAFPAPHLPVPSSGNLPEGVLRDDPPAPPPGRLFRFDENVFLHTLARLPAVRSPWLQEIHRGITYRVRRSSPT